MQKYSSNIADSHGNAFAFATVTVTDSTGALAQIYKANDITKPLANPLTTDALSNFSFYAANGRYSWSASGAGFTANGITDVELFDPAESGAAGQIGTADGSTVQAKLNALDTGKAVLEQAATFATISASTMARFVSVAADETNNGQQTLYFHNGTSLNWIPTQGV